MKMTSFALGLLALLPHAVVSDSFHFQGLLVPEQEHEHIIVPTNDVYTVAEEACVLDAQACASGSTLPTFFLPDFMEFTFNMVDPTPMIFIDDLFQSLLPDIISIDLNQESQELNGFSLQPHHRRLEEVDVAAQPKYLYDCPRVHSCLMQANEQQVRFPVSNMQLLSTTCSRALTELKQPKQKNPTIDDVARSLYHHEHQDPRTIHIVEHRPITSSNSASSKTLTYNEELMMMMVDILWFLTTMLLLYTILCAIVSKHNRRSARRGPNKSERRELKRSILQQIYSNPSLKKQVEVAMGESIGDVPPFPVSTKQGFTKRQLKKRSKRILMLLILFTLPFFLLDSSTVIGDAACHYVALYLFSFVMLLVLARDYHRVQNMMNAVENDDACTCCCCGGSSLDVENGTVSKDQECCGCCQGTGVCPPACQLCCTDENGNCDDCCGCCGEDEVEIPSKSDTYRAPRMDALSALTKDDDCDNNIGSCCEPKSEMSIKSSTRVIIDGEPVIVV